MGERGEGNGGGRGGVSIEEKEGLGGGRGGGLRGGGGRDFSRATKHRKKYERRARRTHNKRKKTEKVNKETI